MADNKYKRVKVCKTNKKGKQKCKFKKVKRTPAEMKIINKKFIGSSLSEGMGAIGES